MKTATGSLKSALSISVLLAAATPLAAAVAGFTIPERFGVVDIIPTNQSGETNQDSEPSLGVGFGAQYGNIVVHAFASVPTNYYYTTASSGGPPWTNSGQVFDNDTTLDWSTAGTCYMASLYQGSLKVRRSSDPASVPFTTIGTATYSAPPGGSYPDQPWVRVVNVTNTDHIFVGFNDLTKAAYYLGSGKTASIRYSLDGGTSWKNTVLEKTIPAAGQDSPAVRLALSADGTTVYALFQRQTSWIGSAFGSDFLGDIVVMRDDGSGGSGYGALGSGNGTVVAHNIVIPYAGGTALGAERLGSDCDVAINPTQPKKVYVAYTEAVSGTPVLRVQSSTNSGASFSLVYSITNASLPALALTADNTVGLLYALKSAGKLEVHFLKAFGGSFSSGSPSDRVLTSWPNNKPIRTGNPYIGDYFTLKAIGYNFYGAFSASGDPQPTHFPSGVFYQRNVKVGGTITNNFTLASAGSLVDLLGNAVAPSIDPFVFYDIAPSLIHLPVLEIVLPFFYNPIDPFYNPSDPYVGITHLVWPVLPENQPQFQLLTALSLGLGANWSVVSADTFARANGAVGALIGGTQARQFFRLKRDLTGAQFNVFASADANGALNLTGAVGAAAGGSQTFTATPINNYAVGKWYLDGVVVQANGPSLTLNNITDEHTVLASFVASNDLAVTIAEFPAADGPTVTYSTNSYVINIENQGLNLLTGVSLSNNLPSTVSFLSAVSTQGNVNHSAGVVTAALGSLNPGASATVTLNFLTSTAGSITDTVSVACSQFEPNLANNTATDITFVYDPVIITNPPAAQTIPVGGNAFFSVGVSGTPPFFYQWFFDGVPIDSATSPTLTLPAVSLSQAGAYSVSVYQMPAAEDIMEADSDPATLTVSVPQPAVTTLTASNITTTSAVLNGNIFGNGSQAVAHFQYGADTNYLGGQVGSYSTSAPGNTEPFSYTLTGLVPNTTYHYRAFGSNCCTEGFGGDTNFTTAWAPLPPTLLSPGTVTDSGYTTFDFAPLFSWTGFGQASSYDLIVSQYPYGNTNVVITVSAYGTSYQLPGGVLQGGTKYAWHMVSFNSLGDESANSGSLYFQTPIPPTVQTLAPTNVTLTSATLEGLVNPNGSSTTAYFEWGATTNYGNVTTQTGIGTAAETFSATISLTNGTYHYRINAANGAGLSRGSDIQFSTAWPPVPPTLISPGSLTADGAPTLQSLTPTFTWSAASQASSSDLILTQYPYGSGNIVATIGVGTASSYQMPGGILQTGTAYAWSMVSFNSVGDESVSSGRLYFRTP